MPTTSIDDILAGAGGKTNQHPETPEQDREELEDVSRETSNEPQVEEEEPQVEAEEEPEEEEEPQVETEAEVDDYGNEKAQARTYTQEEADAYANRIVRERLARMERNTGQNFTPQQKQQQVQQAQQNFEYDAESPQTWQQQLKEFIKQTNQEVVQEESYRAQQQREQRAYDEHANKVREGASRFHDFHDVVAGKPFTDAMTVATRGMKDPAAFIYAVSKRAPQELERISRIEDPYVQLAQMAKLEEKMKQTKPATKAPKPVTRTKGDVSIPHKGKPKETSIEDLIAKDSAKRLALQKKRRG